MTNSTRGIVYVMTTAVSGLVKIGKTGTAQYRERMRNLEANGYYNVTGLKRFFAIELEDYDDKESLLHEIFSKHQVGSSELFSLDQELVQQLLLSFEGQVIYPEITNKEKEFDEVTKSRQQSALFNFYKKRIQDGELVYFVGDPTISAVVAGEREVEFEGQVTKLSPLTRDLFERMNKRSRTGAYQGAAYWSYGGRKLKDIPDVIGS